MPTERVISVGIAQTRNSTEIEKNFAAIQALLAKFEIARIDVAVFPECALSGCSAKMKLCTLDLLSGYLTQIQEWSDRTGIEVVLPTAIVEGERVYNSGFIFSLGSCQQFFKTGLTPSELKFFSVPEVAHPKVVEIKGFRFALIVCREAQDAPWTHFRRDTADMILWPGYWGWTEDDEWTSTLADTEQNIVHTNMKEWQMPLLQANFAFNDLEGYSGPGPTGRSVVVDANNTLVFRGGRSSEQAFVVELERQRGGVVVKRTFPLI